MDEIELANQFKREFNLTNQGMQELEFMKQHVADLEFAKKAQQELELIKQKMPELEFAKTAREQADFVNQHMRDLDFINKHLKDLDFANQHLKDFARENSSALEIARQSMQQAALIQQSFRDCAPDNLSVSPFALIAEQFSNDLSAIKEAAMMGTQIARPTFDRDVEMLRLPPNPNWTSEIFRHLVDFIKQFEAKLDPTHEVGVRLVNFGQPIEFYLEGIEYCESPLMRFTGCSEDGQPLELIQHVSQISILLKRLPRKDPEKPRQPIGFHVEQSEAPKETEQP
jgi:hypothetical protein